MCYLPASSSTVLVTEEWEDYDQNEEQKELYRAARRWRRLGYNVVPQALDGSKHPAVCWKARQRFLITEDDLHNQFPLYTRGLGFITGAVSRVVVIESDGLQGETVLDEFRFLRGALPETLTIRSGSGRGLHRHYKHPGHRVPTKANPSIKLDVKGDGGFCVLPPTKHKSGGTYEIVRDAEPADLPKGLLEFIDEKASAATGLADQAANQKRASGFIRDNTHRTYPAPPINRKNVALVQSMLDALPVAYATEYHLWLKTGFALHDFDGGAVGFALWKKFSARCSNPKKVECTDFEGCWATFNREYDGQKISLGWLRWHAQEHGWRAACSWDRSMAS